MKSHAVKICQTVLALSFAATAFAANKGLLHVNEPEEVAGQELAPGYYTIRWEDGSPDVELKIMRSKTVAATATAHVIQLKSVSPNNAVVVKVEQGGDRSLSQIFFAGKKFKLEIRSISADLKTTSSN